MRKLWKKKYRINPYDGIYIYRHTDIHRIGGNKNFKSKKKKKNSQKSRASALNIFKRNKNILLASTTRSLIVATIFSDVDIGIWRRIYIYI